MIGVNGVQIPMEMSMTSQQRQCLLLCHMQFQQLWWLQLVEDHHNHILLHHNLYQPVSTHYKQ